MLITLYKSTLCPRCRLTRKYLFQVVSTDPEIQVREVDILTSPLQCWKDGVRMIPALKIDTHILSAFSIGKTEIVEFIARHKKSPSPAQQGADIH